MKCIISTENSFSSTAVFCCVGRCRKIFPISSHDVTKKRKKEKKKKKKKFKKKKKKKKKKKNYKKKIKKIKKKNN